LQIFWKNQEFLIYNFYTGILITISEFPDDIDLTCYFDNRVTVTANFSADLTDATQTATARQNVSLADGFSVELLDEWKSATSIFTVGEPLIAQVCFTRFFG